MSHESRKAVNKLILECEYNFDDLVLILIPSTVSRKPGNHELLGWNLTDLSLLRSRAVNLTARVHGNRLQKLDYNIIETAAPRDGIYPDTRQIF